MEAKMEEDGLIGGGLAKDVAIDIHEDEEMALIISRMKEPRKLKSSTPCPGIVIPRIRDDILHGNEKYYRPKVVSIGPYHHEKPHLKPMEDVKRQCLKYLLERNKGASVENCFRKMNELEPEARKCYPKNIKLSRSRFTEMMILDAGFIIELFMEQNEQYHRFPDLNVMFPLVKRDMRLLENQLPFFVLRRLFELTIGQTGTSLALDKLAINFLNLPELDSIKKEEKSPELALNYVHHLLHLYHFQFYPAPYDLKPGTISSIPCATMLDVMGVKFKRASSSSKRRLTDVNFLKPVLEVPRLFIEEHTVALLFNLIAFEQFDIVNGTQFTSYAVFMNYMLSKAEDVEFLCQNGIIEHRLTNHEEVVSIFAKMCSGAFVDPNSSSLSVVLYDIKSYSESTRAGLQKNVWGGRMGKKPWWRAFLKDPITIAISLVGGLGLWLLTFLQTYYTIKG